jgi:hypothetical protein
MFVVGKSVDLRRHPSMANMLLRESRVDRLYGLGQSMGAAVDALRRSRTPVLLRPQYPRRWLPCPRESGISTGIPRAQQEGRMAAHPHPGIPCTVHQDFTGAVGGETA